MSKWAVIVMSNAYAMGNADVFAEYEVAKQVYDERVAKERANAFAASVALVEMKESFAGRYGWLE